MKLDYEQRLITPCRNDRTGDIRRAKYPSMPSTASPVLGEVVMIDISAHFLKTENKPNLGPTALSPPLGK
jgi:hypothetical protein